MRDTSKHNGTQNRRFCAKLVCLAVIALVCAGAAFAQDAEKKANAISLDVVPLFKGLLASDSENDQWYFSIAAAYERLVAPHFSLGVEADLYLGEHAKDVDYLYFGIAAAGRYYPLSEHMEKFFVGASIGFNSQSVDGKTDAQYGGFQGPFISVKSGYKVLMGKSFFAEPSMSYTYSKINSMVALFGGGITPLGWQGGLRIGLEL